MSSLWDLGASIAGASAEAATTAVSGVGNVVRTNTTNLINTTTNAASDSLRKVGSTVSPYIPTIPITNAAQFAYDSTYYVSDNTIRAVQLLPNLLDVCKTKETENITMCSIRLVEKFLCLLKCDEIGEIAKLMVEIAKSDATSQILNEIKELLLELFALLRTSEADALKAQLCNLIEGLQGIAQEHQRQEAARAKEERKTQVNEEWDNPPIIRMTPTNKGCSRKSFPWVADLDEVDQKLIKAVLSKARNRAAVVEKLALLGITSAQATELWNCRTSVSIWTFDKKVNKAPRCLPSSPSNMTSGICTLLSGGRNTSK